MTAEIAILNKTAVALAADSAVTIAAGAEKSKIFDSADKLFELSDHDPIGIMVYNGMNFMDAPLPTLIREFRSCCGGVKKVPEAAECFLEFLNDFGIKAPAEIKNRHLLNILRPIIKGIHDRYLLRFQREVLERDEPPDDFKEFINAILLQTIGVFERVFDREDAEFVGSGVFAIEPQTEALIRGLIQQELPIVNAEAESRVIALCKNALRGCILSSGKTGVVVAGFGADELFPTLVSYEIDGIVCGRLKFVKTNEVDIDRRGEKARVLPFAQKEMVERFVYGIDETVQSDIALFCTRTVSSIRSEIFEQIDFEDDEFKKQLDERAKRAESAFIEGLQRKAYDGIRSKSRSEIEDMVEFMPKPELAKMAEALVNLTSIKRRVTKGLETVGGPIDVAVISRSEGFIWVKRKHYFPPELNARYFERVRTRADNKGSENGPFSKFRRAGAGRGRKKAKQGDPNLS